MNIIKIKTQYKVNNLKYKPTKITTLNKYNSKYKYNTNVVKE